MHRLLPTATKNIRDIVTLALEHSPHQNALVVYDTNYGLTDILTSAYKTALPTAKFINFDQTSKESILAEFDQMQPHDLVVLIQSSSFLLDGFRIRLHLFNKKLKVIEHMHLHKNTPDIWDVYINSLAYDKVWYREMGNKLTTKLENTEKLCIQSEGTSLVVTGGVLTPKRNVGDYTGMENVGGTFPIGEVFTEARDFTQVNGSLMIYAHAGSDFCINMHKPFRIDIKEGLMVGWDQNAPTSFTDIIRTVQTYERPLIREIGFGLNRAITRTRYMQDITAFERILGMHLSIGEKHSVYKKDGILAHKAKFHVDIFPVVDHILCDSEVIFKNETYVL